MKTENLRLALDLGLQAVDADSGETPAEYPLDLPSVFDALIVAESGVFLATMDGRLLAFVQRDRSQ